MPAAITVALGPVLRPRASCTGFLVLDDLLRLSDMASGGNVVASQFGPPTVHSCIGALAAA